MRVVVHALGSSPPAGEGPRQRALSRHGDDAVRSGEEKAVERQSVPSHHDGVADGNERVVREPEIEGMLVVEDQHRVAVELEVQRPAEVGTDPAMREHAVSLGVEPVAEEAREGEDGWRDAHRHRLA